jgi:hypothetical protein
VAQRVFSNWGLKPCDAARLYKVGCRMVSTCDYASTYSLFPLTNLKNNRSGPTSTYIRLISMFAIRSLNDYFHYAMIKGHDIARHVAMMDPPFKIYNHARASPVKVATAPAMAPPAIARTLLDCGAPSPDNLASKSLTAPKSLPRISSPSCSKLVLGGTVPV